MLAVARLAQILHHHVVHQIRAALDGTQHPATADHCGKFPRSIPGLRKRLRNQFCAKVLLRQNWTPLECRQFLLRMPNGAHQFGAVLRVHSKLC